MIDRAAGDYYANGGRFPPRFSHDLRYLPLDLANEAQNLTRAWRRYAGTIGRSLTGNSDNSLRIKNKIRRILSRLASDR